MTIDESIKYYEEEAERIERNHPYIDASEYRQLAEWLKELKAYRENDKEYLQTLRFADMPTLQSAT